MSLNHIDRLFKSAFRTEEYVYKNAYWKDLESRLGPSGGGTKFGKIAGAIAVLIMGFSVSTDQMHVEQPSKESIAAMKPAQQGSKKNSLSSYRSESITFLETEPVVSEVIEQLKTSNKSSALSLVESVVNPSLIASNATSKDAQVSEGTLLNENQVFSKTNSAQNETDISTIDIEIDDVQQFSKINKSQISGIAYSASSEILDGPLPDETEFGQKIKQSSLTQYFIQGGIYYLKLDPDIVDQNNIPQDFEKEFKSFSMTGGEIILGMKRKGFKVAAGIGVSSISKTYAYNFSEEHISTEEAVNSSTYLDNVDSTFSHYEIDEFNSGSSSNFDIGSSVYQVDSTFVTVNDTTTTTSSSVSKHNIALAYQLNYVTVPIQVGYEIEIKRFFVDINAAVQLGVLTNYNGFKYNDETEDSKSLITSKDLNPITLSYAVSLGAGYNVTPTISIIAQPMYSSSIIGAFKNIKPNKISGFGGKLALRYQF